MNKILKIIIAILGGIDVVFNIFIPISLILILVSLVDLSNFNFWVLISIGFLSTIYRVIKFWIIE